MPELKKDGMIPLNYKFRCANSVMVKRRNKFTSDIPSKVSFQNFWGEV